MFTDNSAVLYRRLAALAVGVDMVYLEVRPFQLRNPSENTFETKEVMWLGNHVHLGKHFPNPPRAWVFW